MKIKIFVSILVLQVVFISVPAFSYAESMLYIITNEKNPIQSLSKHEIRHIFLGEIKSYPNGKPVSPIFLVKGSISRKVFMRELIRKNERRWRSHWARLLFTGKGMPPVELENTDDVMNMVSQQQYAIGYFVGELKGNAGIKVLMEIPFD